MQNYGAQQHQSHGQPMQNYDAQQHQSHSQPMQSYGAQQHQSHSQPMQSYGAQQHQSHSQPMQSYDSAPQEPIRHTKEKTLLLDSPLLHAIEEAAGERKVVRRNWPIVVVIILICVIVCLAFLKLVIFSESKTPVVAEEEPVETIPEIQVMPIARQFVDIQLKPPNSKVFINGHYEALFSGGRALPFSKASANVINIYNPGYLPKHLFLDKDVFFDHDAEVFLSSDELYKISETTILPPRNIDGAALRGSLNGDVISLRGSGVYKLPSGLPHHILVQKDDAASHLHVYWPRRTLNENIELPAPVEQKERNEILVNFVLPNELLQDPLLKVELFSQSANFQEAGSFRFPKHEIITIHASHPDYEDFNYVLEASDLGSATIDAIMLENHAQASRVSLSRNSDAKATLCFRRLAVIKCLKAKENVQLDSGRWEILVYSENANDKKIFTAQPFKDLKEGHEHSLELKISGEKYSLRELRVRKDPKLAAK